MIRGAPPKRNEDAPLSISLEIILFEIFSDLFVAVGVSQPFKRLCFDLPDSLSAQTELSSNFFKRTFSIFSDSKSES